MIIAFDIGDKLMKEYINVYYIVVSYIVKI